MDRLEKAFELLKKGKSLKNIIDSMNLTDEETEYLKLAADLLKIKAPSFSKEDKRTIFEKIRENLPLSSIGNFKKRFMLGLVSVLFASSTIAVYASSNAKPDSLLYSVKKAYIEMAGKVFYGSDLHKNLLKREVKEYKDALKKTGLHHPETRKRLEKELQKTMNLLREIESKEEKIENKNRKDDLKSSPLKRETVKKKRKFEKNVEKKKTKVESEKETTSINKNEIQRFHKNGTSISTKTLNKRKKNSEKGFRKENH
ncbi:MAG: hypothetical protein N2440_03075 [Actinobacteria bacterium]|nr:hypothetical protein [Actinomycetota bacterium]